MWRSLQSFSCTGGYNETVFNLNQWRHGQNLILLLKCFSPCIPLKSVMMSVWATTVFASKDFGPALFKPQNSVAVCCRGDQTTTASHLWQSCSHLPAEAIWFMVHSFLSSHFSKMWDGLDLFRFVEKSDEYWWHQHCSVRAIVFFLRFLPPANFAQKCRFGCIRWMYFFFFFFKSIICIFVCVLYCLYDFLCYFLVQMHQSVDEYSTCTLSNYQLWLTKTKTHFKKEKAKEIYKNCVYSNVWGNRWGK